MITRWERGRDEVDRLISSSRLSRVKPNRALADQYVAQARAHLRLASQGSSTDPAGAFSLAYDAARLGLAAILINQGLRPRGQGAHAVLLQAVLAQTEPPRQAELREFDWMRRLRNDTQYPDDDRPIADMDDLAQAIPAAKAILDRAEKLLDLMPPY